MFGHIVYAYHTLFGIQSLLCASVFGHLLFKALDACGQPHVILSQPILIQQHGMLFVLRLWLTYSVITTAITQTKFECGKITSYNGPTLLFFDI